MSIDTIVFDMDGVIVDTEEMWNEVRHDFALSHGGTWIRELDQPKVMGANSRQWAVSLRENNGVDLPEDQILRGIIDGLKERFARELPVIAGAPETIARLGRRYRLGVASSSPLEFIEFALGASGVREHFAVVLSSDEVEGGKPLPHVYLEACRRLGTTPGRAAAVEDSANGIKAAHAAGMAVIAIPNPGFPPAPESLRLADVRLESVAELTETIVDGLGRV